MDNKTTRIAFIVVMCFVLLVGSGVYEWQAFKIKRLEKNWLGQITSLKNQAAMAEKTLNQQTEAQTSNLASDLDRLKRYLAREIVDKNSWNEHSSDTLKASFKYPAEYFLDDNDPLDVRLYPAKKYKNYLLDPSLDISYIKIASISQVAPYKINEEFFSGRQIKSLSDQIYDGFMSKKVIFNDGLPIEEIYITRPFNKDTLLISCYGDEAEMLVVDDISGTLKIMKN